MTMFWAKSFILINFSNQQTRQILQNRLDIPVRVPRDVPFVQLSLLDRNLLLEVGGEWGARCLSLVLFFFQLVSSKNWSKNGSFC